MRPERLRLRDFADRMISLPDGPCSWRKLANGSKGKILLGLGPHPGEAPVPGDFTWLESPKILESIKEKTGDLNLPPNWRKLNREDFRPGEDSEIWFYTANLKLDPDFWGPLLAQIEIANFKPLKKASYLVWLPGAANQLLHRDLEITLKDAGFRVSTLLPEKAEPGSLAKIWNGELPRFALSVNFRGLDSEGRIFDLCRELDIPIAIWLVDNPWNILSGISLPWWKYAQIFVTDPGFIDGLRKAGARNVSFLPLAASPFMLQKAPGKPGSPPLFVGSSAFGGREKYFSGLRTDDELRMKAAKMLEDNQNPDFHWWLHKLQPTLWPGREGRQASLGCDEFSVLRRAKWLQEAAKAGIEIIGDNGWQTLLPGCVIKPQVDYEQELPPLYGQAECVLNITSLLLPESLNQRHFDVWAAGGFLLSDATPGLAIFPQTLCEPIRLKSPEDFAKRLKWLRENPEEKARLANAWRELILKEHTYKERLRSICERLGLPKR